MSDDPTIHPPAFDEDADDGGWDPPDHELLTVAPHRRLLSVPVLLLAAVTVAALGFLGGVQVQKDQGGASTPTGGGLASGRAAARSGALGGGAFAGGGAGGAGNPAGAGDAGGATVGAVANTRGGALFVTTTSGTTVRVRPVSQATITRSASASVTAIHPGDTVLVQGARDASGTILATRVVATATTSNSGGGGSGGGLAALFGGGGGGSSGAGAGRGAGVGGGGTGAGG